MQRRKEEKGLSNLSFFHHLNFSVLCSFISLIFMLFSSFLLFEITIYSSIKPKNPRTVYVASSIVLYIYPCHNNIFSIVYIYLNITIRILEEQDEVYFIDHNAVEIICSRCFLLDKLLLNLFDI